MPFVRCAAILFGACLLAFPAPASANSCEDIVRKQSDAYLAKLQAKKYPAARAIAMKTADACLAAGDLARAKGWFHTARALGSGRAKPAEDAQWRARYNAAVARVGAQGFEQGSPRQQLAEARRRNDGTRVADPSAPRNVPRAQPLKRTPAASSSSWMRPTRLALLGGVTAMLATAAFWLRRRGKVALPSWT